jgi:hypothetical protein
VAAVRAPVTPGTQISLFYPRQHKHSRPPPLCRPPENARQLSSSSSEAAGIAHAGIVPIRSRNTSKRISGIHLQRDPSFNQVRSLRRVCPFTSL